MANICVNLYDGELDVGCDCSGATTCKYALWEFMPPKEDEHCSFRYCGSCRLVAAQIAAIENLKRRLTQHSKQLQRDADD